MSNGVGVKIDVDASELIRKFNNVREFATSDYLENLKERVKSKTPVDTGRLRDSWTVSGLTLENEQPYSGFVEWGTKHQAARLMLTLSILESDPDWVNAIKKNWR